VGRVCMRGASSVQAGPIGLGLALALVLLGTGGAQEYAAGAEGDAQDRALDAAEEVCAGELDAFAACMEREIHAQRQVHPSEAMDRCADLHRVQGPSPCYHAPPPAGSHEHHEPAYCESLRVPPSRKAPLMRALTSYYVCRELCPQCGNRRPRAFAAWAAAAAAAAVAAVAKTSGRNQQQQGAPGRLHGAAS